MNRQLIVITLMLVAQINLYAQSNYLKLIGKDNFTKAEKWITKDLSKQPNDIELNFCKSMLLKERSYEGYDTELSYQYLSIARQLYESNSDEKVLKKLEKIPLNQKVFSDSNDSICRLALTDLTLKNKLESYQKFLDYYKNAPLNYKQEAVEKRNQIAYNAATEVNTPKSYQYFISKYPDASQAFQANERIHEFAFNDAKKTNTSEAFKSFTDRYPQSKQYRKAFDLFEKTQFEENIPKGSNCGQYLSFIENYPVNSWKSIATDSVFAHIKKSKDSEIAQYCVDNFTGDERSRALILYHDIITCDGEKETLNLFYKKYDEESLSEIKTKDEYLATLADGLLLYMPYDSLKFSEYDTYIRLAAPREKAFVALQRMISPYLTGNKWKIAAERIKNYVQYFGSENKKINDLLVLLESDIDKSIKTSPVGLGVNTNTGGEYVPVISADDKLLYFCGRERKDNIGGEDIFVSKKIKGIWTKSKIISDLSSTYSNDAPLSISADGTSMLLFKSGDIYYSDKTKQGWSESIKFPEQINGGKWQADAMISSAGKALVFASTKSGGYNLFTEVSDFHGDNQYSSDIYVSTLNENNEWNEPINVGNVINTPYCERSPFLHPDMKTLYFSSDGHGGLGKLDVYKSTRLADSCWNCWSEPINMGKEFNTQESDWCYKISTNGQVAYFSKTNSLSNNEDIYSVNIPRYLQPDLVATVTGKLVDKDNLPITAEIRWEDLETGKNVGQSKSDPTDGSFFIVLPVGKIYGYYVDQEKYFPISNHIDLRKNKKTIQVEENINMVTFRQMIEEGTAVPVNNLFFNFAESALLSYSIPELKRVAVIFKANHLKVEISGHTDNIGDDQKNQILSEQRAKSVMDFLVNEGCNVQNLSIKGYGKTRPVTTNETEAGRAKNRRVELKFVK